MSHILQYSAVDLTAVAVMAAGTLIGMRRGLSGELARLFAAVAALASGLYFIDPFGSWFAANTRLPEPKAAVLAFLLVMLAAVAIVIILGWMLRQLMTVVIEPGVDRVGGIIAGFFKSAVFVAVIFIVMNRWPNEYLNRKFGTESVIGRFVQKCIPALQGGKERADSPDRH